MFFDNKSLYDKFFTSCWVFMLISPFTRLLDHEFHIAFIIIAILVPSYFLLRAFKEDDKRLDEFIKKLKEMDDRDE